MQRSRHMLFIWISVTFLGLWFVISLLITGFERAEGGEDLASESKAEAIERGVIIADVAVTKSASVAAIPATVLMVANF